MDSASKVGVLDKLVKVDSDGIGEQVSAEALKSSKKFAYTKRKINGICRSLSYDADDYNPGKTLASIDAFLYAPDNMGRILYSEVSSYVFCLNESERGTFSSNIEKLLLSVLVSNTLENEIAHEESLTEGTDDIVEPKNQQETESLFQSGEKRGEDRKKFVIKLYDHFQLVRYQIDNTDKQYAKSIEKTRAELQNEVKGMEKEYITILGIFASIVLAFIGSMTFSTSVLENIGNASIYRIIIVSLIIGFVFLNMIWLLMDFIRNINGNQIKRQRMIIGLDVAIAIAVFLVCIACHFGLLEPRVQSQNLNQEGTVSEESFQESTIGISETQDSESDKTDVNFVGTDEEQEGTASEITDRETINADSLSE